MVSFGTSLIALAIIGVVVLLGWGIFSPMFTGLIDNALGVYTSTLLQPTANQNELICDARVIVHAHLTSDFFDIENLGTPFVRILDSNPAEVNFFDCFAQDNFPTFELLDPESGKLPLQQFFIISSGDSITSEIILRDAGDPTQRVDKFLQPQLEREIEIPQGFFPNGVNVDVEFVVTNIPLRNYNLEIYFDFRIEGLKAGEPYVFPVTGN